jgi:hypothetical protein
MQHFIALNNSSPQALSSKESTESSASAEVPVSRPLLSDKASKCQGRGLKRPNTVYMRRIIIARPITVSRGEKSDTK